jgi:hypothetical protein
MAELIDNLIETMGGGVKAYIPVEDDGVTTDDDIGGGKSRKNRETTQSTKDVYLKNIIRLNDKQAIKTKKNGQFDYDFLKNTKKILDRIEKLKPNSQRTYLISIVTTLRGLKQYEQIYSYYYDLMLKIAEELKKGSNTKSESQQKNWIEQSEVNDVYESLKQKATPLLNKKKVTDQEWAIILDFVVLSLYVLQPPRRNRDYQLMLYVNDKNLIENTEFNYYLPKLKKFEFNQYKTSGTYNTQEVDVNPELVDILAKYAKLHPLNKGKDKQKNFYLLVNYKGEPLLAVNAITRILNKIFGKHVGASLLRNIYLSDKFKGHMEELDAITKSMGTSARTGQDVYIKMDK